MWIWLLLALIPSTRVRAEYFISAGETFTILSGDIEVLYGIPSSAPKLRLQLVQIGINDEKLIAKRDVPEKFTKGRIVFPCGTFEKAGLFVFRLLTVKQDRIMAQTKTIDVRWPSVTVHVPLMVETYSSNVIVQLYVEPLKCKPRSSFTTYVDLVYQGAVQTSWHEPTVLTSKELTGWMWNSAFDVVLDCEFFDRAGNYTVHVRTDIPHTPEVAMSDTILVMWSHRYSVSVAKSSVQPCDGSLSVIYHYPRCILDQDRIRVYGKAPRGPLKYIRESRIENGKHSTKLSCDIFQDEFQEYCFSFVSIARNGAVFDLKTHCLPTLTDSRGIIANWNDWGPWSECSATCGPGVQSRYRLCVSATNSSDCVGKAVQTQPCKKEECPADPETTTEEPLHWDCPCGCEKNITEDHLIKILTLECETEPVWILQAWPTGHVIVEIRNIVFPSSDYWLTIRDGKSALGAVLAIVGPYTISHPVHSITETVRLEIHASNVTSFQGIEMVFLATQSETPRESLAMTRQKVDSVNLASNLTAVHLTIIMLATVLCSTTAFLIIFHFCRQSRMKAAMESSPNLACSELLTSTSELSVKSPSASPEDYLYKSFIFRSTSSLQQPKLKWDLPPKVEPASTASPIRRRSRPAIKNGQRESATPLTASLSELSTGSDDGFEYDYYDYGCHQEPGSFFCPDPVLLGWPPFIPLPPQGMEEFGDYPLQHFTPSPDPT
ncbi:thrombospondin type-1 domain-containing protein 1-like [Argiope bruennichi]|uniref:thrombospondin type-1 domain-containing protein 1-like n=1 Tax=Argiope bruennichi TaxID=94029 RepID=UPI0024943D6D|nr:thrombospondin type-1 domain-containing protein 1-like [Argiope bruennichi]XP_055927222.1 thrombospondin type-1 domain-containing protein 1-like [Argiope bruennichi]